MKKRILSLVLTIAMLALSAVETVVFAAPSVVDVSDVASNLEGSYVADLTGETAEYAIFPGSVVYVTQGAYGEYNSYSHNGQGGYYQNAFDLAGNSNYVAPFSGTITKIKTSYNAVILQSDSKVYWANGDYDYMSVCFVHDNDISNLYVGKHVNQGDVFYQPGIKDPGGYTTGTHLHICVNKGLTNDGINIFSGNVRPNEAFFVKDETKISVTGGYKWTSLSEVMEYSTVADGKYTLSNNGYYLNMAKTTESLDALNSSQSAANKTFTITKDGDFYIISAASGKLLNVWCNNYSTNGSQVGLYHDTEGDAIEGVGYRSQRWYFEECDGGYYIHPADVPSLYLTRDSSSNNIYVKTKATDTKYQIWKLESANSSDESNEDSTDLYPYSSAYKSSKYYTALNNVEMTEDEAADLVNVALSQVGYHEGNSTSELDGSNASGTNNYSEYGYWFGTQVKGNTTGHFYDWCAMFVSWCARHAGISTSTISNSAYAGASNEIYHFSNLSYFNRGNGTPKKGDLIFFDNPNVDGQWDHVGIVESVTSTQVKTIEGNAGEQVKEKTYNLTDTYIQGYGRPNYKNVSVDDSTQWGDWSDWSTTKPTASDTVQVESKTQYGYYHYILQYSNGNCGAYPIDATTFNKIFPSYPTTQKDYHTKYFDSQLSKIDTLTYNGTTYNCYANTCCPDSYNYDNGSNASYFYNLGTRTVYRSRTKLSETISVNSVTLNKNSVTLEVGATESLTATVTPSNATDKTVTWTSSNSSVASVSNGVITANAAGTATITVTTADGNKTATCTVTVKTPTVAVTGVSLNKTSATLTVGGTETLTATVAPSNATNKAVTWTSSNTNVASVSNGVITANAAGTATITVKTADGNKTATCVVTVNAQQTPINPDMAKIIVNDIETRAGETFDVTINITDNPGLSFLQVTLQYDTSVFTLEKAENGDIFSTFAKGVNLQWSSDSNTSKNGTLVTLTFKVKEDVESGNYALTTIFREAYDTSLNDIEFAVVAGTVYVKDFIYGDANGDGEVNGKDAVMLRNYMVNYNYDTGISSVVVSAGADANGDGDVNGKDAVMLRNYMVNYNYDTRSSSVVLGPKK